jgi:hypothetical protein
MGNATQLHETERQGQDGEMTVLIADLAIHPAVKRLHRMPDDDPTFEALAASVAELGVTTPLKVTANLLVVDGRHRLRAAELAGLDAVPVRIVPEEQVYSTVLDELACRRHMKKGAIAYLAFPLLDKALEEGTRRKIANLQKGRNFPEICKNPNVSPKFYSVEDRERWGSLERAQRVLGIQKDLWYAAKKVHEILDRYPDELADVEKALFEDGVGIGAVHAGLAAKLEGREPDLAARAQHGRIAADHLKRTVDQLEFWDTLPDTEKQLAKDGLQHLASWPEELRRHALRVLKASFKEPHE